ncbi:Hypothetical predicted protein [Octopus vulgaris]|uniref:Uncharacterized protein n=1 Tax=Octopus vulgaris TaxID=6645 RepID=A0AA36B2N5_OCTVU|nr:Hypothetical predicted protein [Octopus vulgaris]
MRFGRSTAVTLSALNASSKRSYDTASTYNGKITLLTTRFFAGPHCQVSNPPFFAIVSTGDFMDIDDITRAPLLSFQTLIREYVHK